jgi:hypothetical protein
LELQHFAFSEKVLTIFRPISFYFPENFSNQVSIHLKLGWDLHSSFQPESRSQAIDFLECSHQSRQQQLHTVPDSVSLLAFSIDFIIANECRERFKSTTSWCITKAFLKIAQPTAWTRWREKISLEIESEFLLQVNADIMRFPWHSKGARWSEREKLSSNAASWAQLSGQFCDQSIPVPPFCLMQHSESAQHEQIIINLIKKAEVLTPQLKCISIMLKRIRFIDPIASLFREFFELPLNRVGKRVAGTFRSSPASSAVNLFFSNCISPW